MVSEDVLQEIVRNAAPLTKCITLSTAHMTEADSVLLKKLSRPYRDRHDDSKWIDKEWVLIRSMAISCNFRSVRNA